MRSHVETSIDNTCVSTSPVRKSNNHPLGLSRELRPAFVPYSPKSKRKSGYINNATETVVPTVDNNNNNNSPPPPILYNPNIDSTDARSEEIKQFAELFTNLMFDTKESLDVLMGLWIDQPPNPTVPLQQSLYLIMKTIALDDVDLRVELVVPNTGYAGRGFSGRSDSSTRNVVNSGQTALSGSIHVFRGFNLGVPVVMLHKDCMACVGAMCAKADESFMQKDEQSINGKIVYSRFRYNSIIDATLNRKRVIDRMVDFILMRNPDQHLYMKCMIVSVFHLFPTSSDNVIRDSYQRLLCPELKIGIMRHVISYTNDEDRDDQLVLSE